MLITVVEMKVYLDLVFILNFCYDFLLLLSVTIENKTYPKIKRLLLASLTGSVTLILLFLPLNNFFLLIFKLLTSLILILISFGYKSKETFISNLKSFYGSSIILGGILYALDLQFNTYKKGFLFIKNKNTSILILLLLIGPVLLFFYLKGRRREYIRENYLHDIKFTYKEKTYTLKAFLDTGNKIKDPYKKRSVFIYFLDFPINDEDIIYVPYQTIGTNGLIKCIKPEYLELDGKELDSSKYLVGKSREKLNLYGANCIMPEILKEEIND